MRLRRFTATVIALVTGLALSLMAVGPANAAPASANSVPAAAAPVTVPVTGEFTDAGGGTGTFSGQFEPTRFVEQNGGVAAVGDLTGTLTDSSGANVGNVDQEVTAPVTTLQATCQILHLVLGPLDLNLLGLMVHLDRIVLDISADAAPGNLLGNLLCALAGLLDPFQLGQVLAILNQILNLLR